MRASLWKVAVLLGVLNASAAHAQEQEAEAPGETEAAEGSLDSYVIDPAGTETSGKGPYSPKGKTGKLKTAEDEARLSRARAADKGEAWTPRVQKPIRPFAQLLVGFGRAPDNSQGVDGFAPDATLFTLMVGGMYDVNESISVGLRLPWSTASVDARDPMNPLGAFDAAAFGAPELYGEYVLTLGPSIQLPIGVGLGIPIASGTPDPVATDQAGVNSGLVNHIADAFHGWHDSELFMVKRLPFTPQARLTYQTPNFDLYGQMKFILGFKVGGTLRNPDFPMPNRWEQNFLSVRHVTGGGFTWHFLRSPMLAVGADAWLAWSILDPVEFESAANAERATRFQFVLKPRLQATFGPVTPSVAYLLPVGGRLGDGGVGAVVARADLQF